MLLFVYQDETRALLLEQKQNKQPDNNEPKPKYTRIKKLPNESKDGNQFANGWNLQGRERYRKLMVSIQESRAWYAVSLDKRMKVFATKVHLQKQQKKRRKETRELDTMPNDMSLPDYDTIRREKPNPEAMALNAELLNCVDDVPDMFGNSAEI